MGRGWILDFFDPDSGVVSFSSAGALGIDSGICGGFQLSIQKEQAGTYHLNDFLPLLVKGASTLWSFRHGRIFRLLGRIRQRRKQKRQIRRFVYNRLPAVEQSEIFVSRMNARLTKRSQQPTPMRLELPVRPPTARRPSPALFQVLLLPIASHVVHFA